MLYAEPHGVTFVRLTMLKARYNKTEPTALTGHPLTPEQRQERLADACWQQAAWYVGMKPLLVSALPFGDFVTVADVEEHLLRVLVGEVIGAVAVPLPEALTCLRQACEKLEERRNQFNIADGRAYMEQEFFYNGMVYVVKNFCGVTPAQYGGVLNFSKTYMTENPSQTIQDVLAEIVTKGGFNIYVINSPTGMGKTTAVENLAKQFDCNIAFSRIGARLEKTAHAKETGLNVFEVKRDATYKGDSKADRHESYKESSYRTFTFAKIANPGGQADMFDAVPPKALILDEYPEGTPDQLRAAYEFCEKHSIPLVFMSAAGVLLPKMGDIGAKYIRIAPAKRDAHNDLVETKPHLYLSEVGSSGLVDSVRQYVTNRAPVLGLCSKETGATIRRLGGYFFSALPEGSTHAEREKQLVELQEAVNYGAVVFMTNAFNSAINLSVSHDKPITYMIEATMAGLGYGSAVKQLLGRIRNRLRENKNLICFGQPTKVSRKLDLLLNGLSYSGRMFSLHIGGQESVIRPNSALERQAMLTDLRLDYNVLLCNDKTKNAKKGGRDLAELFYPIPEYEQLPDCFVAWLPHVLSYPRYEITKDSKPRQVTYYINSASCADLTDTCELLARAAIIGHLYGTPIWTKQTQFGPLVAKEAVNIDIKDYAKLLADRFSEAYKKQNGFMHNPGDGWTSAGTPPSQVTIQVGDEDTLNVCTTTGESEELNDPFGIFGKLVVPLLPELTSNKRPYEGKYEGKYDYVICYRVSSADGRFLYRKTGAEAIEAAKAEAAKPKGELKLTQPLIAVKTKQSAMLFDKGFLTKEEVRELNKATRH